MEKGKSGTSENVRSENAAETTYTKMKCCASASAAAAAAAAAGSLGVAMAFDILQLR